MTQAGFDRAKCGAMSVNDLAAAFEALVGEPPEKRNKLWMLKRMEQAAAARGAVDRAAARASGGTEDGGSEREVASEPAMEPADGSVAREPTEASADSRPAPSNEGAETAVAPPEVVVTPASPESAAAPPPIDAGEAAPETAATAGRDEDASAPAPSNAALEGEGKPARRRYIPARFRAMTLDELHAMFAEKVGRPTKSSDVPYLCWRITRAERLGDGPSAAPRRSRRAAADGTPRGEAKAVTLREYPDTLAAVEGVCARHGMRNRLDFFRRAARHFLEHLGEGDAAAFFAEMIPAGSATSPASLS